MSRPKDPVLPGIGTALNADTLLEALQGALPECADEVELISLKKLDVRYRPGHYCNVLYRLKFRDRVNGFTGRQPLNVRVLGADEAPKLPSEDAIRSYRRYRAEAGGRRTSMLATPAVHLAQAGLVICAFPFDAEMPTLIDALDPETAKRGLTRMWAERDVRIKKVKVSQLGYTPEARAALRYDILGEDRATGLPELRHLIGKIHVFKPAYKRFAAAWALWRAAEGRFGLAPPVGFVEPLNLSLQERVDGVRLTDLADTSAFISLVRKTAKAISVLHGLSLPVASWRMADKEVQVVERWSSMLATICPDQAQRVERLRDRISTELASRTQMIGPVHGDFHLANVLVDNADVTLIDLDEFAFGDSLVDIGRLLAGLRVSALRIGGEPDGLIEAGEAFLEEYLSRTQADESRVRLFEAAALIISAGSPFRLHRRGWRDAAAALLDESERVFELACRGPKVAVGAPAFDRNIPPPGVSRWARDDHYVRAMLTPFIREAYDAEIKYCRVADVTEVEDGVHVRYKFSGWQGDEPWSADMIGMSRDARSGRGRHERIVALSDALRDHDGAPRVPRPIAYVSKLNMSVFETPRGDRLAAILDAGKGPAAGRKLGRVLAALHETPLVLSKSRSVEDEFAATGDVIESLSATHPDLAVDAKTLLSAVAKASRVAPKRVSPMVRPLSLHRILIDGENIVFGEVKDVVLAHPFTDFAAFVAQFALYGLERQCEEDMARVVDVLRSAYLEAVSFGGDGLAAFEAGALLRAAAVRGERGAPDAMVDRLMSMADATMSLCEAG